jgi:hypothetical protein
MTSFFRFVLSSILLTAALAANGQNEKKDYVITVTEDTIYGKLRTAIMGHPRLITENDKITCDPEKIQAYYKASKM